MVNSSETLNQNKGFEISGISGYVFLAFSAIIFLGTYTGALKGGLIGSLTFIMALGGIITLVGDNTPILKDYLGGGAMLAIFGAAAMSHFNLVPEGVLANIKTFVTAGQFLNFYIAALITGSILGMDRKLLMNSFLKYIPVILGGVAVAMLLTGAVGALIGFGFVEGMLYIALPIMGGGVGAGAIPLSEIFAAKTGADAGSLLGIMMPALTLGNGVAIVVAGLLDRLGQRRSELTGHGSLMKTKDGKEVEAKVYAIPSIKVIGTGAMIAGAFYILGTMLSKFIPIHPYALMIIAVAAVKFSGILPESIEEVCFGWYKFMSGTFTIALLVGVGLTLVNLQDIINAMTIQYILLVFVTVIGSVIGSGIVGHFLGMFPIESAITGGLCMANTGGTGDIAVLSAAKRMELMSYAQISSRLGGAMMILLATFMVELFL